MVNKSIATKNKIETTVQIKVAPFRSEIRKTNPHKHNNYFEIIYLSEGSGFHTIDHTAFPITPPTFFFVRKEQVHHWDITIEPKGFVILLKKEFIETSLDHELKKCLTQLSVLSCLTIKDTQNIDLLFNLLITEKNFTVTEGILKALLAKILTEYTPLPLSLNNKRDIASMFQNLLKLTDELYNSVEYYAKKLKTTPQNLNAICRKASGQSASKIIAEHIIDEAKRQLLYTENSISEIAYNLNFNDSSYFIKYFKRYTSNTPKAFRDK